MRLFFTSNSAVFVGGGAKVFFPGAQDTLATPLYLIEMQYKHDERIDFILANALR